MKTTRREIIGSSLGALGAALLPPALRAAGGAGAREPVAARALKRPHLLVTAGKVDGLRSVAELRTSAKSGHGRTLWEELVARYDRDTDRTAASAAAYALCYKCHDRTLTCHGARHPRWVNNALCC